MVPTRINQLTVKSKTFVMMIMKNVQNLTKLSRLTKRLVLLFCFIISSLLVGAKKSNLFDGEPLKKTSKDSSDKYGFKSLLNTVSFDPAEPFFAQLNPQVVSFVNSYVLSHAKQAERINSWGKPYLDMFDAILGAYGLPKELKYLSIIESELKSGAVSIAGAVGPWQIMSFEARRVGLIVNRRNDERTSYSKSTHAAAKILKESFDKFGDWLLVIAAYNAGGGRVSQAIKKSGSRNFWVLQKYLPLETRNHVKKFIATHYLFEGNGGLTTLTAAETESLLSSMESHVKQTSSENENGYGVVEINGKYNSAVVVKNLGMDITQFNRFNPGFDKQIASGGTYKLKLPLEKLKTFEEKKQIILNETIQLLLAGAKF